MKQSDLEARMTALGVSAYRRVNAAADASGYSSRVGPGVNLTQAAASKMDLGIQEWWKSVNGKAGRNASNMKEVALFAAPDGTYQPLAALMCRVVLDQIARRRKYTATSAVLGQAAWEEYQLDLLRAENPETFQKIVERQGGGRGGVRGLFRYARSRGVAMQAWDRKALIKFGCLMLEILIHSTGIVEISRETTKRRGQIRTHRYIVATQETQDYIKKSHATSELLRPFWLPCVEKPKPWTGLWSGGYHNLEVIQKPMVRARDRSYLNELEDADLSESQQTLNNLQAVAWTLNPEVYEIARHLYEESVEVPGLPDLDTAMPPKPSMEMPKEERRDLGRALEQWRNKCRENSSRRVFVAKTLFVAKLVEPVKKWYRPWYMDFRGRCYDHTHTLSAQGDDFSRGLAMFAEGKAITTEAGENWFYIIGANLAGKDKLPLEERIDWTIENHEMIMAVYEDPLSNMAWATQDDPWQFLAWALEYGKYQHDKTSLLHVPCHVDGSCNGLACFSLLLRDPVGAAATNCLDLEDRRDIYLEVAAKAKVLMQADDPDMAKRWLDYFGGEIPRKMVKRPVMIVAYSGTRHAAQDYVIDEYADFAKHHGPPAWLELGGTPYKELTQISGYIWEAIDVVVVAARTAMDWLREVADIHTDADTPIRWWSPSGFPCYMHTRPTEGCEVQLASRGKVRVAYRQDMPGYNKRAQRDGMAPNFIHCLDAACLHKIVNKATDEGITSLSVIHDSFATHPDDLPRITRIVKEVYAEVFSSDLLAEFESQVQLFLPEGTKLPPRPPLGDLDVQRLLKSRYFIS